MTLIIIYNKQKQSEVFGEKKKVLHNHNFLPAMHGWGISPYKKRSSKQEKGNMCKTDLCYQKNTIISFFSKFLVKFLRNSIKYVASRAVSGALLGALKVALLRAMAIQSAFSDDSFK